MDSKFIAEITRFIMPEFPLFKKTQDNRTYYKIYSEVYFEEIKKIGANYLFFATEAKQLPERNYIRDLVENEHMHLVKISEEEFEKIRSLYEHTKK